MWLDRYQEKIATSPTVPQGWQAELEGDAISPDLSALRFGRSRSPVVVTLELDQTDRAQPWEHWLNGERIRQDSSPIRDLRVRYGWRDQDWVPNAYSYVGPPELRNDATTVEDVADPGAWMNPRSVLHLVGRPVNTAAGWRLRVRGSSAAPRPATKAAPTRVRDDEGLVNVSQVMRGAAGLTGLVVIQAEPVDHGAALLDGDREGFLALAYEAAEACGRACVVVPPLDVAHAAEAVDVATTWCAAQTGDTSPVHLIGLVDDLRRLVGEADDSDSRPGGLRAEDDVIAVVGTLPIRRPVVRGWLAAFGST